MKYLSTLECAKKWGISQRRVSLLCSQGRIYGALKTGNTWIIPEYSVKPSDERNTKGERNTKENTCYETLESNEVCEQSMPYGQQLSIDPGLLKQATDYFTAKGETISDVISQFLYDAITSDKKRIGIAKNLFEAPENIDFCNSEVLALFGV